MKRLNTTYIFFLFLVPILFSCNKESFGNTPEEKIIGTWSFDKVKFKPSGENSYSDFTNGFKNCTITFNKDSTLSAFDAKSNITAEGTWYIDWYTDYDNDDDDTGSTVYELIGTMDNADLGIFNDVYWDNFTVSNKKISAVEEKQNGKYKYDLVRIN